MTPSEFKAWFDGFTEAFADDAPTYKQWGRIKARVAEIDGKPVTERVYVDRYLPSLPPYRSYPYWGYANGIGVCNTVATGNTGLVATLASADYSKAASFNSMQAMADLGRSEASSFAA